MTLDEGTWDNTAVRALPAAASGGCRISPPGWMWIGSFVVYGDPVPQGSKTAIPIYKGSKAKGNREFTGRSVVKESSSKTLNTWRGDIREAVTALGLRVVGKRQVYVAITFTRTRPQSAPKNRETYPVTRPDADKLARAVLDAMKSAGAYEDDSQVDVSAIKRYPGQLPWPGMPPALDRAGMTVYIYARTP